MSNRPELSSRDLDARLHSELVPLVIDVREPDEYKAGTVPGATNAPYEGIDPVAVAAESPPGGIVFVCTYGGRSSSVCFLARRAGIERAHYLEGGLNAWAQAGLPLQIQAVNG
jgi:rhodanese-related sulfurtransferase